MKPKSDEMNGKAGADVAALLQPDLDAPPKMDLDTLKTLTTELLDSLPKPDGAWLTSLSKEQFDQEIDEQLLKLNEQTCIDFLRSRGFTVTPGPERAKGI